MHTAFVFHWTFASQHWQFAASFFFFSLCLLFSRVHDCSWYPRNVHICDCIHRFNQSQSSTVISKIWKNSCLIYIMWLGYELNVLSFGFLWHFWMWINDRLGHVLILSFEMHFPFDLSDSLCLKFRGIKICWTSWACEFLLT